MSNVAFLLIAVSLSALGTTILWLRHRKPTGTNAGINQFQQRMQALAPDKQDRTEG